MTPRPMDIGLQEAKPLARDVVDANGAVQMRIGCSLTESTIAQLANHNIKEACLLLGMDEEEAFSDGLRHDTDTGQFIISCCFRERYGVLIRYCNDTLCSFPEAEQKLLQPDHAQVNRNPASGWSIIINGEISLERK